MSLKDLSKEQKQYVALGALAAAILVILMVLGIRFSMATVSEAKVELDDLTAKIDNANHALSRSRQTGEEYVKTVAVLREYLTNAPPERNYYSWATEVIYARARFADLEIDSIDEISIPQRQRSGPDNDAAISFESYSLRIMAHGGYENTKYFMNLLKQDYPLLRFSGVEISSGQNPDMHDIQLFMQWPFNFGAITKNWDKVVTTQVKMDELSDEPEGPSLEHPGPAHESAVPVPTGTRPDPAREPHPPTTRPEVEKTPAPKPVVEPTEPKTQPGTDSGSRVDPASIDPAPAPKPAPDEEIQALLSNAPPPAERMDEEPQHAVSVSESIAAMQPVLEPETVAAQPESAGELQPHTDLEISLQQEPLSSINEIAASDSAPAPGASHGEAMEAAPQMDPPLDASEDNPMLELSVGAQSVSMPEAGRQSVSTGESEKIHEDLLNKESTGEDSSLMSLLESMAGEIDEK